MSHSFPVARTSVGRSPSRLALLGLGTLNQAAPRRPLPEKEPPSSRPQGLTNPNPATAAALVRPGIHSLTVGVADHVASPLGGDFSSQSRSGFEEAEPDGVLAPQEREDPNSVEPEATGSVLPDIPARKPTRMTRAKVWTQVHHQSWMLLPAFGNHNPQATDWVPPCCGHRKSKTPFAFPNAGGCPFKITS